MKEALALLEVLGPLVGRAWEAYQKARELAAKAGATEQDLTDADARFLKRYADPLPPAPHVPPVEPPAEEPPVEPPPPPPPPSELIYDRWFYGERPTAPPYEIGDHVHRNPDGVRWMVGHKDKPVAGTGYIGDFT